MAGERHILPLRAKDERERAKRWIDQAPTGTRVEFLPPRRSNAQNDRMWLLLRSVAAQLEWYGERYAPEDWKDFFMHQLARGDWMPDENGRPTIAIRRSTSRLSKARMADLMLVIEEFCARHDIQIDEQAA